MPALVCPTALRTSPDCAWLVRSPSLAGSVQAARGSGRGSRGQESSRPAAFERGRVSAPSVCRLHLADKRWSSALAHGSEWHEFLRRWGHRPEKNSFCDRSRTAATAPPECLVEEYGIVEDGRGPRNSCHILHNDGRVDPSPLDSSRPYVTYPG